MAEWPALYGLAKGVEAIQPWVQYAFMEKEREKERRQKFVSEYYMDLLKRGEIEREPAPIAGPMAGPVPSTGALAGFLRPPAPTPRPPTAPETFDIMEALSEARGLPSGYKVTPTKIPEGLKPYEYERAGVKYRAPYEERPVASITLTPTGENIESFEAYMPGPEWQVGVAQKVPVSSFNRYLSSVRGYKAPDYVRQRDRVLDQATTMWKEYLKSPDVAKLSTADQEKIYLDLIRTVSVQLGVPIPTTGTILEDPTTLDEWRKITGILPPKARIKGKRPSQIGLPGIDELFPEK